MKARALRLKIFMISQVFRVTIIPYQQGLQWFEKNIQSMMYKKLICLCVPLGGITSLGIKIPTRGTRQPSYT